MEVLLLSNLLSLHSLTDFDSVKTFFQLFGNGLEPLDTGTVPLPPHPLSTDCGTRGEWDVLHSHQNWENLPEWNLK